LGQLLGLARGANRDLARLGLLADGDADLEHAVVVAGLDRRGVQVVGEADAAGEAAEQPLTDDRVLALGLGLLARRADGEDALVDGHVDLVLVHAGHVEAENHLAVAANGVHRQGRRVASVVERTAAERAPDDAVKVTADRVESRQVHRYLLRGLPPGVVSPFTRRKLTTQVVYSLTEPCQVSCSLARGRPSAVTLKAWQSATSGCSATRSCAPAPIRSPTSTNSCAPWSRTRPPAAHPVTDFDKQLRSLVKDLTQTLADAQGAGLAAPQIGVGLRVFAYAVGSERGYLVNPNLESPDEEEQDGEEGCLSFPGVYYDVRRRLNTVARGFTDRGDPGHAVGGGVLAAGP